MSGIFSQNKFILIGAAVVVAGFIWYSISSGDSSSSLLETEVVSGGGPDAELVTTLLALRAVKLDNPIFSDPAFLSLKDFSTTITQETAGRPNPFAPLGVVSAPTAASAHEAQIFAPTTPAPKPAPAPAPRR